MRRIPLRAFLAPLQREQLQGIADTLGLPSSREFIPTISAMLKDSSSVESILNDLSPDAVSLLRSLCYTEALRLPIRDQVFTSAPSFTRLQNLGLAGMGKEYWGTLRVVLPDETTGILLEIFQARDAALLVPATEVTAIAARADSFLRNATTLIAIAEKETIPLTSKGDIAKAFLQKKILPLLELGTYPSPLDGRYPFDFHHLHDFCCYCGILHRQGQAVIAGETAESFLEADDADIGRALLAYASNSHDRLPIAWLAGLLSRLEPGAWVALDALVAVCHPDGLNKRESAEHKLLWHEAATLLEAVGLFDSGTDQSGGRAIRLGRLLRNDAGQAAVSQSDLFIVTPDFKISAPRNLRSMLRREISRLATLVKSDMMDQWELSRESICRAIDEGRSAASILQFLAENSSMPVPRNVTDSVNSWEKTHADIRFHEGPLLIVENASEATLILDILQKEGALLSRPADTVFLLHPKRAESALARIRARRTIGRITIPEPKKKSGRFADIVEKLEKTREKPGENVSGAADAKN